LGLAVRGCGLWSGRIPADPVGSTHPQRREEAVALSAEQAIPDTRGGRVYRRILVVAGLSAVVGVADQLRALMWLALLGPGSEDIVIAQVLIKLSGWVLLGWLAYRGIRQNLAPPGWALCTIPILVWSYALWPS